MHHGKLYCFYKDNQIFSAMLGSPNLSFLFAKKMKKPRQYELALHTNHPRSLWKAQKHIEKLRLESFSDNVFALEKYKSVEQKGKDIKVRKKGNRVTYKKFP